MFTQPFTQHDAMCDLRRIIGNLRDEDDICSTRNAGMDGDPSRMASHHFDDDNAAMAFRRRVQFVERVPGSVDGSVEAECDNGAANIVIDSLRNTNQRHTLLVEFLSDAQRAVAADHNQCVEAQLPKVRDDHIGNIALDGLSAFTGDWVAKRIGGVGGAEYCAAKMKNAGYTGRGQRPSSTMHQACEAFFDSEGVPSEAHGCFHRSADHGVQARTVSAARQYPDSHGEILLEYQAFLKLFHYVCRVWRY